MGASQAQLALDFWRTEQEVLERRVFFDFDALTSSLEWMATPRQERICRMAMFGLEPFVAVSVRVLVCLLPPDIFD